MINVYLPENERWYDFYNFEEIKNNKKFEYAINPEKIGAFIKGGEIIQKKMRIRRSIQKMKNDPLTIVIALNLENKSKGIVYFDDEESFEYQNGKYSVLEICYNYKNNKEIEFKWINYNYEAVNNIEKIIIIGESDLSLFGGEERAELITQDNNKYIIETKKDYEKKQIEIIRLNKYKLTEIKRINLI